MHHKDIPSDIVEEFLGIMTPPQNDGLEALDRMFMIGRNLLDVLNLEKALKAGKLPHDPSVTAWLQAIMVSGARDIKDFGLLVARDGDVILFGEGDPRVKRTPIMSHETCKKKSPRVFPYIEALMQGWLGLGRCNILYGNGFVVPPIREEWKKAADGFSDAVQQTILIVDDATGTKGIDYYLGKSGLFQAQFYEQLFGRPVELNNYDAHTQHRFRSNVLQFAEDELDNLEAMIDEIKPQVILAFGKVGLTALTASFDNRARSLDPNTANKFEVDVAILCGRPTIVASLPHLGIKNHQRSTRTEFSDSWCSGAAFAIVIANKLVSRFPGCEAGEVSIEDMRLCIKDVQEANRDWHVSLEAAGRRINQSANGPAFMKEMHDEEATLKIFADWMDARGFSFITSFELLPGGRLIPNNS